jgi:hypothetical protein
MSRPLPTTTSYPVRVARFIQFRSELAILVVLALGVAAGVAVRQVLSVSPGPSAVIASPDPAPAERRQERARAHPADAAPARSPQVVD